MRKGQSVRPHRRSNRRKVWKAGKGKVRRALGMGSPLGRRTYISKSGYRYYIDKPLGTTLNKKGNYYFRIVGKRWFERTNGNTYHSTRVYKVSGTGANYKRVLIGEEPFSYGYGDMYIQTAHKILQKAGYYPKTDKSLSSGADADWYNFSQDMRNHREKFVIEVHDVDRKKDL